MLQQESTKYRIINRNTTNNNSTTSVDFFELIPKLTGYIALISLIYGIIKLQFYYGVLFKIPIFQYLDISEIILISPLSLISSLLHYFTIIVGTLYFLGTFGSRKIWKKSRKIYLIIILAIFGTTHYVVSNGILTIQFPLYKWYEALFVTLGHLAPMFAFVISGFFIDYFEVVKKYSLIMPFVFIVWLAFSESYATYYLLTNTERAINAKLKLKDGKTLKSNKDFKYIGRTNKYWFFLLTKTGNVRAIKDEDVEVSEFNMIMQKNKK